MRLRFDYFFLILKNLRELSKFEQWNKQNEKKSSRQALLLHILGVGVLQYLMVCLQIEFENKNSSG